MASTTRWAPTRLASNDVVAAIGLARRLMRMTVIGDLRGVERCEADLIGALGDHSLPGTESVGHQGPLAVGGPKREHPALEALSAELYVGDAQPILVAYGAAGDRGAGGRLLQQ